MQAEHRRSPGPAEKGEGIGYSVFLLEGPEGKGQGMGEGQGVGTTLGTQDSGKDVGRSAYLLVQVALCLRLRICERGARGLLLVRSHPCWTEAAPPPPFQKPEPCPPGQGWNPPQLPFLRFAGTHASCAASGRPLDVSGPLGGIGETSVVIQATLQRSLREPG